MTFVPRLLLMGAAITVAASFSAAQERTPQSSDRILRAEADETTYLNISERRITEHNFVASTSVGFDARETRHLSMQVGADVRAQKIDVSLRNVTGTVRFRGSVERILNLIKSRPAPAPRAP